MVYYRPYMSFFCLLWLPLYYLFHRAITADNGFAGGVWALITGTIVAMLQFFLGYIVDPVGFGFSRWINACVDIVSLPAVLPILIYLALIGLKIISGTADFTGFTLLWLIPTGAIRALGWSHQNDPVLLVAVPVLWTAIAVGVPFFINFFKNGPVVVKFFSSIAILFIPLAAASSYWAYFAHKLYLGSLLLSAAAVPMIISAILSFVSAKFD